jgi:hypothetical protein
MRFTLRLYGLISLATALATAMPAAAAAASGATACAAAPAARATGAAAAGPLPRHPLRIASASRAPPHVRLIRRSVHPPSGPHPPEPDGRPRATKKQRAHASKAAHQQRVKHFDTVEQAARHLAADDRMFGAYMELKRRRNAYESLRRQVPRLFAQGRRAEAAQVRQQAERFVGAVSAKKTLARYIGMLAGGLKAQRMDKIRRTVEGIMVALEQDGVGLEALGRQARAEMLRPDAAAVWHGALEALVQAAEGEEAAGQTSWLSAHEGADGVWLFPLPPALFAVSCHQLCVVSALFICFPTQCIPAISFAVR